MRTVSGRSDIVSAFRLMESDLLTDFRPRHRGEVRQIDAGAKRHGSLGSSACVQRTSPQISGRSLAVGVAVRVMNQKSGRAGTRIESASRIDEYEG